MRAHATRPRRGAMSATLLAASLVTAPAAAQPVDPAAMYRALMGEELPAADPPPLAVGAFPGGPRGMIAVATLEAGGSADDDLGPLTVGLLSRHGSALSVLASNAEADEPDPKRAITPSTPSVAIDPAIFRISPGEVAVGVDLVEELTTSSTSASASTLRLYRRVGRRLALIFSASTQSTTVDKTPGGRELSARFVVRFTPHATRGFYDLVLQRRGERAGRTFSWNGVRYAPAGRR